GRPAEHFSGNPSVFNIAYIDPDGARHALLGAAGSEHAVLYSPTLSDKDLSSPVFAALSSERHLNLETTPHVVIGPAPTLEDRAIVSAAKTAASRLMRDPAQA